MVARPLSRRRPPDNNENNPREELRQAIDGLRAAKAIDKANDAALDRAGSARRLAASALFKARQLAGDLTEDEIKEAKADAREEAEEYTPPELPTDVGWY